MTPEWVADKIKPGNLDARVLLHSFWEETREAVTKDERERTKAMLRRYREITDDRVVRLTMDILIDAVETGRF